jgi:hypothetical protein
MGVADETKAEWTASVQNALAIPDAGARDSHASALQDGLNAIPAADRWTDSRSPLFGLRSGWDSWSDLYAQLREARSEALVQTGVASPQALAQQSPAWEGAKTGLIEFGNNGVNLFTKTGSAVGSVGSGLEKAAKALEDIGYFVPLAILAVLLLALYRRAS